jgi:solute carrier family 39 (zinc transporter), member 9
MTATLGLVVHAAADGIALGAAAASTQTEVEMIVFVAIMLHKAPAAFGLVTILLHHGLDKKRIRRHLIVFSMAAPLGALLTFFCIGQVLDICCTNYSFCLQLLNYCVNTFQESKETLSSMNATGAAMLFSAGTFLYVATVHVLPELMVKASRGGSDTFNPLQLLCLVCGTVTPLMLSVHHGH